MDSTWQLIAQEHLARKWSEAEQVRPATAEERLSAARHLEAEQALREEVLDRLYTWLHHGIVPASSNALYRLTLTEAIFSELPWVRVSFVMQHVTEGGSVDESTLTFTFPDGLLVCTPHLQPASLSPTTVDEVFPVDEFPDATEFASVDEAWVIEVVEQFVRAALARQ